MEDSDDQYMLVNSEPKAQKEISMNDQFNQWFETGLLQIPEILTKKVESKL